MKPEDICTYIYMHVQDACITGSQSGAAAHALRQVDELHASIPFKVDSPLSKPFTSADSIVVNTVCRDRGASSDQCSSGIMLKDPILQPRELFSGEFNGELWTVDDDKLSDTGKPHAPQEQYLWTAAVLVTVVAGAAAMLGLCYPFRHKLSSRDKFSSSARGGAADSSVGQEKAVEGWSHLQSHNTGVILHSVHQ